MRLKMKTTTSMKARVHPASPKSVAVSAMEPQGIDIAVKPDMGVSKR